MKRTRRAQATNIVGLLAVVLSSTLAGCNQKPKASAPAAAASAAAPGAKADGAKKAKGPCADYATKLCAKVGEQASLCGATKVATSVMAPAACTSALKQFSVTEKLLKEQRKGCEEIVTKLCADEGKDSEPCKMIKEKIPQVPAEQCAGALEHYADIKTQIKRAAMANAPMGADQQAKIAASAGPGFGPANAKVTVVEFSDFECPYCSQAATATEKLREKYSDRIRFVFRQFPLPMHPNAQKAAEAALAAHAQGKFWEYHDLMFKNQQKLDPASLEGYAQQVGLNVASFKDALSTNKFADQVKADMQIGQEVGVQGTPSMFINGKRIENPSDFAAISSVLDGLLKTAG